jgi:hypothetical protein
MLCIVGVLNASALSSKPRASRMFFLSGFFKRTLTWLLRMKTHFLAKAGAKVLLFFDLTKYFHKKMHFSCIFQQKAVFLQFKIT